MIVGEYTTENGVGIRFFDDAFAEQSESLRRRAAEELRTIVWRCAARGAEAQAQSRPQDAAR